MSGGVTQQWGRDRSQSSKKFSRDTMCKSGVSGNNNKVQTETNESHKGEIVDTEQGITFVSLHVNTFFGTLGGMIIIIILVTCLLLVCAPAPAPADTSSEAECGCDHAASWDNAPAAATCETVVCRGSDSVLLRQCHAH